MANGTCYKTIRKLNDFSNSMRWTCYEDIEDTVPELIYQLYKDYSLGKDSVLPDLEKIYVLHEIQHKNLKTIHRELDTSLSYQSLCRHYRYYMKSKKKMNENGRKKDR